MGQRDLLGTRVLASHLVVSVDKVKQYSTDPERFATVSIGIGDRVLYHKASDCKALAKKQRTHPLGWAQNDAIDATLAR